MRGFDEIFFIAAERKGGAEALNALIVKQNQRSSCRLFLRIAGLPS
jgi:hypothetical protein